jgi:hypothetical protein
VIGAVCRQKQADQSQCSLSAAQERDLVATKMQNCDEWVVLRTCAISQCQQLVNAKAMAFLLLRCFRQRLQAVGHELAFPVYRSDRLMPHVTVRHT